MPVYDLNSRLDGELRYTLRRCSKLTDAEMRLLALLGTYKHGSLMRYCDLQDLTGWSRAKLARVVRDLVNYGLVIQTYRAYKFTTLKIAPAEVQTAFAKAHDVSPARRQRRLTHETMTSHQRDHDVSPVRPPMLERELQRKLESSFENEKTGEGVPREPGDVLKLLNQASRAMREVDSEG